ncbi:MAG: endonuclease [Muribaculaceae bacterium]|nr:endonuclease [Muribaculaceae bacterium]
MCTKRYTTLMTILMALGAIFSTRAAAPAGYYNAAEGKSGQSLLTALKGVISSHKNVGYDGLWDVYKTSDVYPDGTIWDMYSTKHWKTTEKCGNYSAVGDCYNREHSVPKSWFNDASPMVSDAFHIYPTDGKVNGQRGNYPFGECAGGSTLSSNGSVKALGRLGRSTYPGYTGTVFEPDDQYKGDFARTYFYMAACYNDRVSSWDSDMFGGNSFPVFSSWAMDMLLKWHREDPVSDKERDRNDAVYAYQNNRNPFIDYPELAEHIWGNKSSQGWSSTGTLTPEFVYPASGTTFNIGNTAINNPVSITINVRGANLSSAATVTVSDSRFKPSATSLAASAVNSANGAPLVITFTSATAGAATATVTLTAGSASVSFKVSATAYSSLTALDPVAVTDDGFTARWVSIDPAGTNYNLYVAFNGSIVGGYPVSVPAANEHYDVTGLDPMTTYTYWLESPTLQSNVVTVTTAEPIPQITFLFDGDLVFYTTPGEPSDVAEILAEIDNIAGPVTVKVSEPFQLSTDRTNWSTSISLVEGEDRFYLRVYSAVAGNFTTYIQGIAGDYLSDDAMATAVVADATTFVERFPTLAGNYNSTTYEGEACNWTFDNAGVFNQENFEKSLPTGTAQCVRFGKNSTSSITMAEDKSRGAGKLTYYTHKFNNDAAAIFALEVSTNNGASWTTIDNVTVSENDWILHTHNVNLTGDVRFRFRQTSGSRFNLGHIEIGDYAISTVAETLDYHSWDTYCLDHELVVTSDQAGGHAVKIFDMQGITRFEGTVEGRLSLPLPAGIYIVLVDDFTRRVAVR